ncbi:MAG: hypothetical protein RLP09_24715 [Sandaracinaceae bacterium]
MRTRSRAAGVWVCAWVALAPGCALTARVEVGPTLDTDGAFGVEARLRGTFGPGNDTGAWTAGAYGSVGGADAPDRELAGGFGGVIGADGIFDDHSHVHGELLLGARSEAGRWLGALGVQLGAGYALLDERGRRRAFLGRPRLGLILGLDLRVEYVWGAGDRALFALPVYLALYRT